jgi:hypothetical protein
VACLAIHMARSEILWIPCRRSLSGRSKFWPVDNAEEESDDKESSVSAVPATAVLVLRAGGVVVLVVIRCMSARSFRQHPIATPARAATAVAIFDARLLCRAGVPSSSFFPRPGPKLGACARAHMNERCRRVMRKLIIHG